MSDKQQVIIYTDGACLDNPVGPGGYGAVLITTINGNEHRKEFSGGFTNTTNNRMEMMAVIIALESLKKSCVVKVHSDSRYIVDAINLKWVVRWKHFGWRMKRDGQKKPKNIDLWKRLLAAMEAHEVTFVWVQGHAGIAENERCDYLATAAAMQPDLPRDKEEEEKWDEKTTLF